MQTRPGRNEKKKLTILVVPDGESTLRRWRLPAWVLGRPLRRTLAVAALVLALHYGLSVYASFQVPSLLAENRLLRDQLAEVSQRVEMVEGGLARIESLDHRVRHILGIEYESAAQSLGMGGPLVPSMKSYEPFAPRDAAKLRQLDADIELSTNRSKLQEQSLEDLLNYFSEQRSQLASTPSVWPVRGWLTSDFGMRTDPFTGERRMHEGVDVATSLGAPVMVPADGVVVFAGARGGYGKVLTIDHGYGIVTNYGHLSEIKVQPGQHVRRGEAIASVGSTGRSTGPHLHYEVLVNNVPVNPMNYILN